MRVFAAGVGAFLLDANVYPVDNNLRLGFRLCDLDGALLNLGFGLTNG
jgi:hypothetical protein